MTGAAIAALLGPAGASDWFDPTAGASLHNGAGRVRASRPEAMAQAGPLIVAIDGRIDDRAALAGRLNCTVTASDAELVLAAWRRWGQDCARNIIGDYAIVVLDAEHDAMFCARDHIGARPLFYGRAGGRTIVASRLEDVLAAPFLSNALDERALASRIVRSSAPLLDRTYFRDVRKVPPGHRMLATADDLRIDRYWQPEHAPAIRFKHEADYAAALRELIETAVADRMPRAGPLGVHVSGGLDCGAVAAVAARLRRAAGAPPPLGFSWNPPPRADQDGRERRLIDATAAHLGMTVHHGGIDPQALIAELRADGLFAPDASPNLHEYAVQRTAAERGVAVILSGWGGDEAASFNGRCLHEELLRTGRWERFRSEAAAVGLGATRLAARVLRGTVADIVRSQRRRDPDDLLLGTALAGHDDRGIEATPPRYDTHRILLHGLLQGHLTRRIEAWGSSAARRGIEYRYPLLDRRILDFVLGVPVELFRRGDVGRWLMRQAVAPWLPACVVANQAKEEPARVALLVDRLREVFPAIASLLAAPERDRSRDDWIDMAALHRRLHETRRERPRAGAVLVAVQLLHW